VTGGRESPGASHSAGHTAPDWDPAQGNVAALIRALCSQGLRRGVRVVAADKRGHIFFDQGHVVHAEFGEDVGLGAVMKMLHCGAVEFRPCARPWPSQHSLFFTAEKLLAATRPGASNVLTGVRRKPGPDLGSAEPSSAERPELDDSPPLPNPELAAEPERGDPSRAKALRPEALREVPRSEPPAPAAAAGPRLPVFSALSPANYPPLDSAVSELSRAVAAAAAAHRSSAPRRAASSRAPSEVRSRLQPARPPTPRAATPPPSVAPVAAAPSVGPAAVASAAVAAPVTAPGVEREPGAPPLPRTLPVTWVRRTLAARPNTAPSSEPASGAPPASTRATALPLSTSMVRVSGRGMLLAARGEECERLANAAAFIHNQAKLIAADLGRHGRTAVHLKGGGLSLLVVKSEVNDIAAALGSTERLRSLLRKVGLG